MEPFADVSVLKEASRDSFGTIRFKLSEGDLRKQNPPPKAVVEGDTLIVTATLNGDEYGSKISGLSIQPSVKINVEKTTIDVTVKTIGQCTLGDKIGNN